ncbi:MAG: hypothetical protein IKK86_02685 [Alistipes sp.]|nr:hypothetical protein [Alistipes sp.]
MKQHVWRSAFLACLVVLAAAVVVVACDSSDDSGKKYDFEKMEFTFTYEVSDDVLALADVTFSYEEAAADGTMTPKEDTLTTKRWQKVFEVDALPADFQIGVAVTPKEGVTYDKTSYTLQMALTEEFKEYRTDGKVHWMESPDIERHSVTLPCDPANPAAFEAALKAELALWTRNFAYVVKVDPEGGYDVEDND